jgi:phosphatidylinositol N-acetylglucosaminyltransferase subunit Y
LTIAQKVEKAKYQSNDVHQLLGYAFILLGLCFWVIGAYATFFSKLVMPYTGNVVLDWIKDDKYYVQVFPAWCLVIIVLVWLNWLSMKFFRHT